MAHHILRIDSSARVEGSISRQLTDKVVDRLSPASVTVRDLRETLGAIDELWLGANWTPPGDRTPEQKARLAESDHLIEEIQAADVLVIGAPIYNFAIPGALKVWIDLIARAGVTFKYTETGPVGLLEGKRAVVVVASGGTQMGSDIDFATGYLRHVLGFVGIHEVEFIAADQLMAGDPAEKVALAEGKVAALAA
ncbi:MAG: FMN-dependent NADH-azoreductase [Shimia sp.]